MDLANVVSISDEPRCKKAHEKLVAVQLEGHAIERRISEHLDALGRPKGASLDEQARDYLRTGNVAAAVERQQDGELEQLYAQRRVNAHAAKIARDDYVAACEAHSRETCAQLSRSYGTHAQRIADALAIVMDSVCAERDFRAALEAKGIRVSFPPAAFPYLGYNLDEPDKGFAARWIKDARQAGLIR